MMDNSQRQCWDCKTEVSDYVMERRQVSGGDGVVYSGDFQQVPVCANRRTCRENQMWQEKTKIHSRECLICGAKVPCSAATEQFNLLEHFKTHSYEQIFTHLQGGRPVYSGMKQR